MLMELTGFGNGSYLVFSAQTVYYIELMGAYLMSQDF